MGSSTTACAERGRCLRPTPWMCILMFTLVVNDEVSWRQREISFGRTGRRGSGTVMAPPPEIPSLQSAFHEGRSRFDPVPLSPPWWDLICHAAAKIVGREAFALASLCGHTMRAPPKSEDVMAAGILRRKSIVNL